MTRRTPPIPDATSGALAAALAGLLVALAAAVVLAGRPAPMAAGADLPPLVAADAGAADRTIDWQTPGDRVVLPSGWSLTTGAARAVEVADARGRVLGTLELHDQPVDDELAAATGADALRRTLVRRAEDSHNVVRADRAASSEGRLDYRAEATIETPMGGTTGVRWGAAVVDRRTGAVVERIRTYAALSGGRLWVLSATGVDRGGRGDGPQELTPAQLEHLLPELEEVIATSPLPTEGTAVVDGIVVGVDGGPGGPLDGGALFLVWEGRRQRIQQPRPVERTDLAALGLRPGPRIAELSVAGGPTGSAFFVVPPDGPDARLHVALRGVLHEVVVQPLTSRAAAGLPLDEPTALDRLVRGGHR